MKLYYYTAKLIDGDFHLSRSYHKDDWNFTGRIRYVFEEKDKEPAIEFETRIIDNSWYVKLFPFAFESRWRDSDILFDETEPYEPFIHKKVIVDCN